MCHCMQAIDLPSGLEELYAMLQPGDCTMLAFSFRHHQENAAPATETLPRPSIVLTYARQSAASCEQFEYMLSFQLPRVHSSGLIQPYLLKSAVNVLSLEHHGRQPLDRPISCEYSCTLRVPTRFVEADNPDHRASVEFALQKSTLWSALGFTSTYIQVTGVGMQSNKVTTLQNDAMAGCLIRTV